MTDDGDPIIPCSTEHPCAECEDETDREDINAAMDRDHEDCWDCGGDGYLLDDCGEDSCACAQPELDHDLIMCPTCRGTG